MTEQTTPVFDARTLAAVRSVGGVLPPDLIAAVITGTDLPGMGAGDYHLELGVTPKGAADRAWAVLGGARAFYRDALVARPRGDPATGLTSERSLSVLLRELGFGRVSATPAGGLIAGERSWPISHQAHGQLPIHLLGWRSTSQAHAGPGRRRGAGPARHGPRAARPLEPLEPLPVGPAGQRMHAAHPAGLLDTRRTLLRFDLAAIFDGELFSDVVALYLLCHRSRFEPNDPDVGPASAGVGARIAAAFMRERGESRSTRAPPKERAELPHLSKGRIGSGARNFLPPLSVCHL